MKLSQIHAKPCTMTPSEYITSSACTITQPLKFRHKKLKYKDAQIRLEKWEPRPPDSVNNSTKKSQLSSRWMEYQGIRDWEGLLDPLDNTLRNEIIRYGHFVDATYRAFNFDTSSSSYAKCRYNDFLLDRSGFLNTGYRVTRNLYATSGIQMPQWISNTPSWTTVQSSWVGYVAISEDKKEIARLGRRDIVIAYRGTATCMEWLENLRATLSHIPSIDPNTSPDHENPMVESGFLSLYTSKTRSTQSLQQSVRDEINKLIDLYPDEPISLTFTGHSLGAALATLTAYDIKTTFKRTPLVTVVSFGGPRVGNRSFRHNLEKCGVKVLRIVNSDDLITKVPGFVINQTEDHDGATNARKFFSGWLRRRVEDTRWVYADVGKELLLRSRDSPELAGINVATCHDLKTYLHLVNGFVSSTCPFRATARKIMKRKKI